MNKQLTSLLIGTALLTACNQEPAANGAAPAASAPVATSTPEASAAPAVAQGDAVAIVNGVPISKTTFKIIEEEIEKQTHGQQKIPKQQLLDQLIQGELLVQEAHKKQLDQNEEVKGRIEMATRSLLSRAALEDYRKTHPIGDAEIKATYEKEVVAKSAGNEYKARHILVKTEDEAKKVIAELTKGGKFNDLAKKYSIDTSNKEQGGDLGWFAEGQMVEPFSKAVAGMEKGKFSQTPVQTQFGWHVILKEDSRPQTPPPLDEGLKEQIRHFLEEQQNQTMLKELRGQAKIETLMTFDEPKPEAAPAAAEEKPAEPAAKPESQTTEEAKPAEAAPAPDAKPAAADKAAASDAANKATEATDAAKPEAAATAAPEKAKAEPSAKPAEPTKK